MNLIHYLKTEKYLWYLYRFEDSNIKLLDYIFYIFIVMFDFMFKNENNDLVSSDDFFIFYKLFL